MKQNIVEWFTCVNLLRKTLMLNGKKNFFLVLKVAKLPSPRVYEIRFEKWRVTGIWPCNRGNLRKCDVDISTTVWGSGLTTPCLPCCFLWCLRFCVSENRGKCPREGTEPNPSSLTPLILFLSNLLCLQSLAQMPPLPGSFSWFLTWIPCPNWYPTFPPVSPSRHPAPC